MMFLKRICLLWTLFWLEQSLAGKRKLNEYITHYETLDYSSTDLHASHQRAKRSAYNPHVNLKFTAHSRHFHLRLKRDTSIFSSNFKIETHDKNLIDHDTSYIYEGTVVGEPQSYAHGSVIDGVFAGHIRTRKDVYYVERSDRYIHSPHSFHSIIYSEKDIDHEPFRKKRSTFDPHGSCGYSDPAVSNWMSEQSRSATESTSGRTKRSASATREEDVHAHESAYSKYTYERNRRETKEDDPTKRTCSMFLQSDTMLWEYMTTKLKYSATRSLEEITSMFATHIQGIKEIYGNTVFKNEEKKYSYQAISFVVHRIKINKTSEDCPDGTSTLESKNAFCRTNIDVSNFLNLNSLRNHDEFCLAYIFTYRDFTGGTLGLAWVGSPERASGGVCERWKPYNENRRSVYKSLNTGIVTIINYSQTVPPKVSTLTFAHEVGHNFGSPHDSGKDCTPYVGSNPDEEGNYIMFASATSGDRIHNSQFSPCSRSNISAVINSIVTSTNKHNCFEKSEAAFCGNMIVEEGEQCDCGYADDCTDVCCYPKKSGKDCTLKGDNHVECSPSQGPCCHANCSLIEKSENYKCKEDSDCSMQSSCIGNGASCPVPQAKPNNTACNKNTQVCYMGDCRGSICETIGWEQCYLVMPANNPRYDRSNLCFVSCRKGRNGTCVSSKEIFDSEDARSKYPQMKTLLDTINVGNPIQLPPGAPCDNFQGYCDVFHKCRGVDADGPLARLKNLLFNEKTFSTMRDWIVKHWWAVLLMGIGLIIVMGLFIKLCAVHTPSSNPTKAPARKISLRAQPRGPPPPYPGPNRGGPAHGKGRSRDGSRAQGHRGHAYEMKGQQRI